MALESRDSHMTGTRSLFRPNQRSLFTTSHMQSIVLGCYRERRVPHLIFSSCHIRIAAAGHVIFALLNAEAGQIAPIAPNIYCTRPYNDGLGRDQQRSGRGRMSKFAGRCLCNFEEWSAPLSSNHRYFDAVPELIAVQQS